MKRPASRLRRILGIGALVSGMAVALAAAAPMLGLLDAQEMTMFSNGHDDSRVAAVFVSGDMGLRFGLGQKIAPALAARGVPVVGVSAATAFASHRTRAQVDAVVAGAIRTALAHTGADKVILIGQSFGADIVATAAPDLAPDLRSRVAAVALIVPATTAYFRADPMGFAYHGTPDAEPAAAMRGLDWAPVVCIHGVAETDSLCPALSGTARVVGLPGGHFLRNDDRRVVGTLLGQLHAADPSLPDVGQVQ